MEKSQKLIENSFEFIYQNVYKIHKISVKLFLKIKQIEDFHETFEKISKFNGEITKNYK